MLELNEQNFEAMVLKSEKPVLVDFWAPWCAPCRVIAPVIESLAKEYGDRFLVGKINVDENPNIAQSSSVLNIPTIIFYKNGKEEARLVGVRSKDEISRKMEEILGS